MMIAFTLSMPGSPSWNGKWSGEGRKYAIVRTFRSGSEEKNAAAILAGNSFGYGWSDGWYASVRVQQVDSKQAAKLRKESVGFAGYEWMVDSIIRHGVILASHEVEEFLKQREAQKCDLARS